MNQLEEARREIDAVDEELAKLFERRMQAVADVAAWKKTNNMPVFDGAREEEVLQKNRERIERDDLKDDFGKWMQYMMDLSKKRQREMLAINTVAYCGVEGAFAYSVTEQLYPHACKMGCQSFEQVFQAVVEHKAQYGILPLENTNSGLVGEVLDGLLEFPVYIHQIADVRIEQCLLGLPEAELKDIQWVYSKDQALWQAKNFLDALQVETIPYPNTAMAAQFVASQQDVSKAAIGARENAELYNLKILAENIEFDASNTTRFLVISARENEKEGDHSSLLISVKSEVGYLAKAINVISAFGLNMDCLQSRPRKGHPFEYFFYVQMEGRLSPANKEACLQALRQVCAFQKWLGSYSIRKEEEA